MTVLAATDRSENSRASLRLAARLAGLLGEELLVVSVVELWERSGDVILATFEDETITPSEHAIELVAAFVDDTLPDTKYSLRVLVGYPPTDRIVELAEEVGASMIVAGTSGHSPLAEAFFGSTISALARSSYCPVLAVPPGFAGKIDTILAPVDFSVCSQLSLGLASRLAQHLGARLLVQHSAPFGVPTVAPPLAYMPEAPGDVLQAAKERLQAMIDSEGLTERVSEAITNLGPPHPDIIRAVEEYGVELIVMGTHGRHGMARFFLGSTAERMLRDRPCPVLIVRHSEDES